MDGIESITLVFDDVKVALTVEKAKKLRDQLNDLFGGTPPQKEYVPYPVYPTWPRYWYWSSGTAVTGGTYISGNICSTTPDFKNVTLTI